ncbi:hypothetical protein [Dyella agri]|uniref:Lipoprotein n=1 Tax=Dyella agri TaxID=1926869 RepID=A0ABW8KC08_9GAMM
MKRLLSGFVLVAFAVLLSGCYYDPGYSYVRATPYAGPAYYGNGVVYGDGYYAAPGWYGGWYDGWYGCCYAPGVTVGGVWYGRGGYRHYHGGGWRGGGQGHWNGSHSHTSSHGNSGYHH